MSDSRSGNMEKLTGRLQRDFPFLDWRASQSLRNLGSAANDYQFGWRDGPAVELYPRAKQKS